MRRVFAGVAILVLALASAAAFAAWRYRQEMAIATPKGIEEAGFVRIGGIDQWIQIRGDDRANPVLLWVSGGPGFSVLPETYFYRDWEKHFTLVMWDQRGEGKSFEKSGTSVASTMSIPRMTQDGIEVAQYLRAHLHKDKIILLGHSWGSILGTHMASKRPDLFYAYVGTGQVSYLKNDVRAAYPRLLAYARQTDNQPAVQELTAARPPPYPKPAGYFPLLKWANALDPPVHWRLSPAMLWALATMDRRAIFAGAGFSQQLMLPAMLNDDLAAHATFAVPVIIIDGPDGFLTPEARSYFDKVAAPHKEFYSLPGAGHLAIFSDRKHFLDLLLARVRPLAMAASAQ